MYREEGCVCLGILNLYIARMGEIGNRLSVYGQSGNMCFTGSELDAQMENIKSIDPLL